MNYKFDVDEIVQIKSIISCEAKIVDRLSKQEINLYQIEVLEGDHKGKLLWFAEHEIYKK